MKTISAIKLFCTFFNIIVFPYPEFILHGPGPNLSNSSPYKWQSHIFCTHFLAWEQHGFVVKRRCWPGERDPEPHTVLFHLAFPFGAEATRFFKAVLIFFWRKHLVLWQLCRRNAGAWRVSSAWITWFRYGKCSWHFHVPVSGHEKCEKAKVCLHLQNLIKVFRAKIKVLLA